jgi:hypothetical protein
LFPRLFERGFFEVPFSRHDVYRTECQVLRTEMFVLIAWSSLLNTRKE